MSAPLTAFIGILYLVVAADHYLHGRTPMGLTFLAYAVANVGLVWAERGMR